VLAGRAARLATESRSSAQPAIVRVTTDGAHNGDDLLDLRRIGRMRSPLLPGRRPDWNPGIVAGDRRRPARSSSSLDMTPRVVNEPTVPRDERLRAPDYRIGKTLSDNAAWRAAVEISNEPAVSAFGVTAERDGWGQLIVAVGDIHTAESFPDSLATKRHPGTRSRE
jgi:hypothetical protein